MASRVECKSPVPDAGDDEGTAGWITLSVQFDDEEQACFVVLGLGPCVDVIEPERLRDRVASDVAAVITRMSKHRNPESSDL